MRWTADGQKKDFILDQPAYQNAKIIVAGDNLVVTAFDDWWNDHLSAVCPWADRAWQGAARTART
jgi:hypothetical protein